MALDFKRIASRCCRRSLGGAGKVAVNTYRIGAQSFRLMGSLFPHLFLSFSPSSAECAFLEFESDGGYAARGGSRVVLGMSFGSSPPNVRLLARRFGCSCFRSNDVAIVGACNNRERDLYLSLYIEGRSIATSLRMEASTLGLVFAGGALEYSLRFPCFFVSFFSAGFLVSSQTRTRRRLCPKLSRLRGLGRRGAGGAVPTGGPQSGVGGLLSRAQPRRKRSRVFRAREYFRARGHRVRRRLMGLVSGRGVPRGGSCC